MIRLAAYTLFTPVALVALHGCPSPQTTPAPDPEPCDELPDLPVSFTTLEGFSGAEDFAFDADGGLVSVDLNGNLTSRQRDGTQRIIAPGFGEMAGTAYLPDGNLVIADAAEGSLLRVTPAGGSEVLLGGLSYPNGVAVSPEGMVYVADQSTGDVWQVDGVTGDAEIIASKMFAPNGVALGADGTLFVGSFGGGTVHAIEPAVDGFAEPSLLGSVGDKSTYGGPPCDDAKVGDYCLTKKYGLGTCEGDGTLSCQTLYDTAACEGAEDGAACTTELFGETIDSACQGADGFCPYTASALIDACDGASYYGACTLPDGGEGVCAYTAQGVNACVDWGFKYGKQKKYKYKKYGYYYWYSEGNCDELEEGDACQVADSHYPYIGTCNASYGSLLCMNGGGLGGLDGIGVDACDNVYVTEFVSGKIWRFGPEGGDPDEAVSLPSSWIPNLHWGTGVGGWRTDALYVMDRDEGRVFELEVGVSAKVPVHTGPSQGSE